MRLIIEALLTTLDQNKKANFAPMGIEFKADKLLIKPFKTTDSFKNLLATEVGVVNITDNILAFTKAALAEPILPSFKAEMISGRIYKKSCYYYEFRVKEIKKNQQRALVEAEIVKRDRLKDFIGYNRAANLILEILIAVTRLNITWSKEEIDNLINEKKELIIKTGGELEREALRYIKSYLNSS